MTPSAAKFAENKNSDDTTALCGGESDEFEFDQSDIARFVEENADEPSRFGPEYYEFVDSIPFNGFGEFNHEICAHYDEIMEEYGSLEEAHRAYLNTY